VSPLHPATPARPLDGLRVLDFGQYLAGPMVAMFLADFGTEVIHVDPPGGARWKHPANAALYRGKRTTEMDVKTVSAASRGGASSGGPRRRR